MKVLVPATIVLLVIAAGCASTASRLGASATLASTSGSTVSGSVHFTELKDGEVEVKADLTGLTPGMHGFHIHEKGDCGDNAKNAGGHFNPGSLAHGAPTDVSHHAGDFGNVTADAKGEVHTTFTTHSVTVAAGPNSVVGHAVVVHEKDDDLKSQPAGNAGGRFACGVVALTGGAH
ncbi:MAG TPA: superoxide dismutase family protein [Thermoanaerobaculia bacterium]|nr:superoxide dismutase family protein [Thermoanaerobaculia bacterium]